MESNPREQNVDIDKGSEENGSKIQITLLLLRTNRNTHTGDGLMATLYGLDVLRPSREWKKNSIAKFEEQDIGAIYRGE